MVLVFGANGNVGSNLLSHLRVQGINAAGLTRAQADIKSEFCINRAIKQIKPETIINCTAITNVDWCEDNEEAAMNANGYYVEYIAAAAKRYNAKFIHISTDYVFDGNGEEPYTEESIAQPLNIYGKSKLLGEEITLKYHGVVGRVQWVLGYARPNYLDWMIEKINKKEELLISEDQYGAPTDVNHISECLILSHRTPARGELFHWSMDNYVNRYELGLYIARAAGADESLIKPASGANFGKAKRPLNTRMNNSKFKRHFGISAAITWQQQVDNYLRCKYGFQRK